MNTDIRVDVTLPTHRKLRRLEKVVGPGATKHLTAFWIAVATSQPDGQLHDWTCEDIEAAALWEGGDGELFQALLSIGWLDEIEGGYTPHDWEIHQPYAVKAPDRKEQAKRAANARWNKCPEHAPSMRQASMSNAPSPSPSPKRKVNGKDDDLWGRFDGDHS